MSIPPVQRTWDIVVWRPPPVPRKVIRNMSRPQQLLAVGVAPVGDLLLVAAVDHVHLW